MLRSAIQPIASSSRSVLRRELASTSALRLPTVRHPPSGPLRSARNRSRPSTAVQPVQWGAEPYDGPLRGNAKPSPLVNLPPDPNGVLQASHGARKLLAHDTLVIVRQIEMMNIFIGFEQANRYAIYTPESQGEVVGFLAEEDQSFVGTLSRQFLRTHRPFKSVIMDQQGTPILWIRRPFQFINSKIFVRSSKEEDGKLIGEAQQEWHPWRRRYNVFQSRNEDTFSQFARIDSGLFAWDFWLKDRNDRLVASINRNFRGLGRELFTDTGQYVIRFDAAGTELDMPQGSDVQLQGQRIILPTGPEGSLTLDQRAMTLATAVSIDFDFFSRHSGSGGMGFPLWFWGRGDGSAEAQRGGTASDDAASGAMGGAAAGAAGGVMEGNGNGDLTEDEQIYGRQSAQPDQQTQPGTPGDEFGQDLGDGYGEDWNPDGDEVMEDPWGGDGDGGGLFGGGGGGGGGDWGDWGQ